MRLLDDDSPVVRSQIQKELIALGDNLGQALLDLPETPTPEQRLILIDLLEDRNQEWLKGQWESWETTQDDPHGVAQLERALGLLSAYQEGCLNQHSLSSLLDGIAEDFRESGMNTDARSLALFLFGSQRFVGEVHDYYSPRNSNLIHVIETGRGLPLSLAAIYILVGSRLGLSIQGCSFPGHFMARVERDNEVFLVDCFNRGHFVRYDVILSANPHNEETIKAVLDQPAPPHLIIRRVLRNLDRAYRGVHDAKRSAFALHLLDLMELRATEGVQRPTDFIGEAGEPTFAIGELVQHQRYGYRGVIVDFDLSCQADESWYQTNQTQPNRDQPWYMVLVHGTNEVTYAAQSSLDRDPRRTTIAHPLLDHFFENFDGKRYVRNTRPWKRP